LYKCVGADQVTNYSSRPVPGASCKTIGYKGGSATRGHSPIAFGSGAPTAASANSGASNGGATSANAPVPSATDQAFAGSVSIPTAVGAPAIAKVDTPSLASGGAGGSMPQTAASPTTWGSHGRVTHKTLYKYTDANGVDHLEDELHKPKGVRGEIVDEHTETCRDATHCLEVGYDKFGPYSEMNEIGHCFACRILPGVNFGTMVLNTSAYALEISAAARMYGVDEALVRAIIHAESDYNPNAVSYKGAQGLMQLMPGTASRFGVQNPFAAAENINGGVQYLSFLSKRFNGDVRLIAAAYNAGEGNVDRYGGVPPFAETQRYVERVGTLAERYRTAK
jgi:hypothetical protein